MIASSLLLSMPGGTELLVILVIVLILFGNKIPGVARSLGAGVNEFKAGLREGEKRPEDKAGDKANGKGDKPT
ncbi:MAG: Sec-independent protein translocase subunit TatA/TatB [Planctomycetota bacterium]